MNDRPMLPNDERLDRMVESLQQININLEGLRVALIDLTDTSADHEQRLRSVERWRYNLTPVVAAVTFLLGAIGTIAVQRLL
jgi:hypothetical protein